MKNSSFPEKVTLSALMLFAITVFTAVAGFVAGFSITPCTILIGVGITLISSFFIDKKLFLAGILNIFLLVAFTFLAGMIFDWSYDGMYYHKQAVITLKEGWNPLFETAISRDVFASYPDMSLWLENYPKGLWIFSASIYSLTNLLETAKGVNILFIIAVVTLSYNTMNTVFSFSKIKSILFGVLFAVNPVFISQVFTFYNDLAVGSLFIIALLLCIRLYHGSSTPCTYAILFSATLISPLIKFTAPALLGLIYIVFGILCFIKHRHNSKWMIKPVSVILCGFLAGVFLLGFDPYTEHIINSQHIIHPVMGNEKYDIMNTNPPKGFDEINPVSSLGKSIFSQTSNDIQSEPKLKIPFTVHIEEIEPLSNADARIGGFGVLFSGILILSAITALIAFIFKKKPKGELLITLVFLILLSVFFPESWWARYASFIYYIPLFLFVYTFSGRTLKPVAILCALAVLVNSSISLYAVVSAGIEKTSDIENRLSQIKAENKKIILRVNDFPTHIKLFSEYGIDFEVSHEPISPNEHIFYRNTKYKFTDQ